MTVLTGQAIYDYRHRVLLMGLRAELRGMRLTRGRSAYSIIKHEFGLRGSRQSVCEQFERLLAQGVTDAGSTVAQ